MKTIVPSTKWKSLIAKNGKKLLWCKRKFGRIDYMSKIPVKMKIIRKYKDILAIFFSFLIY